MSRAIKARKYSVAFHLTKSIQDRVPRRMLHHLSISLEASSDVIMRMGKRCAGTVCKPTGERHRAAAPLECFISSPVAALQYSSIMHELCTRHQGVVR